MYTRTALLQPIFWKDVKWYSPSFPLQAKTGTTHINIEQVTVQQIPSMTFRKCIYLNTFCSLCSLLLGHVKIFVGKVWNVVAINGQSQKILGCIFLRSSTDLGLKNAFWLYTYDSITIVLTPYVLCSLNTHFFVWLWPSLQSSPSFHKNKLWMLFRCLSNNIILSRIF